ncbi:MAG: rhomboid family intramembrane serine protease [Gemmatimonadetes bacterium]|nr:rhomboid family intramembrane serine protease [Gemmatimonadota bacterium]
MSPITYDDYDAPARPVAVYWLIGACVAVYFVQATLLGSHVIEWLGYRAGDVGAGRPWTLLSYQFVHGGLLHLVLNLWTLWLFGPRVEMAMGRGTFTWFYLWCGVGGWAVHALLHAGGGTLVGASAAILGVAVAYATRWPDDEVLFFGVVPMKVYWLVVFMALVNMLSAVTDTGVGGGTAYLAHLGGMAAGWLFLRTPGSGSLDRFRQGISHAPDHGDEPPRAVPKTVRSREADDIVAQSRAALGRSRVVAPRGEAREPVRAAPVPDAVAPLDAVLDKIAAEGMESLTPSERLLLDAWSRRLRESSGE